MKLLPAILVILVMFSSSTACVVLVGAEDPKGTRDERQAEASGEAELQKPAAESPATDSDASRAVTGDSSERVQRSEKEWRKLLTREEYRVLRMKGTEKPYRNKYDKHFEPGTYACAGCGQELFAADTKFNSGCGWPAFYASMAGDRVVMTPDYSLGMVRTEVTCARCDSHLGHIFNDAPQTPTGQRYCINSVSLKFIPAESKDENNNSTDKKPIEKAEKKSAKGEKPSAREKQNSRD